MIAPPPWTAIVPLNFGGACKTRLAAVLSPQERQALALAMARHVVATLAAVPDVATILLVAPHDPDLSPARWVADRGRGLNVELAAARPATPTLFIHADLPLLMVGDVAALLAAARRTGAALAPDAAGQGTNALALARPDPFTPVFGPDSAARHRALLPGAATVQLASLAIDVDDPGSLAAARDAGLVFPG